MARWAVDHECADPLSDAAVSSSRTGAGWPLGAGVPSAPRGAGDDAGFTLAEVIVAAVIVLIIALSVISALTFAVQASAASTQRTKALNMATQYIERARNLSYDLVGTYSDATGYGDPPGSIHTPDAPTTKWDATHPAPTYGTDLTVVTKVTWQRSAAGRSQYKNVEVTVSWTKPVAGSVKLATSVFGKTDLSNVGDLQLTFRERSTNQPIPDLAVSVRPYGATDPRTVTTDANGVAFFGMVPTGAASMTVSSADWVFDASSPGDVPAINVSTGDVLSKFTVLGQKASNLRVRALGTHGDALAGVAVSFVAAGSTRSVTTGADGYAVFAGVPAATYSVTASRSDREPAVASVAVPVPTAAGQVVDATITLHDPILVRYKVTGSNPSDLKTGATVTFFTQQGTSVAVGQTDSGGLITFSTVTTGTYYATASLGGATGRNPAAANTYITLTAADYGNQDAPIGQSTGGLPIQLASPSTIRVRVVGTGGGTFPYVVPITVDGVSHNSAGGTWDFIVSEVRPYSVQAVYPGYRPFGDAVLVSAPGQIFPVTALLDSVANMTVEVRASWGQALLTAATVSVAGPKSDSVSAASGSAAFNGTHALYGTNQPGDTPYTVTASRSGYRTGTMSGVNLVPGQTLSPNPVIYLVTTNAGTFAITTKSTTNVIRPNATIRVTGPTSSPDGIASTAMTYVSDAAGKITIANLPRGTYTFAYKNTGSTYSNVSSPSSVVLSTNGQTQTFDVKW